MNKKVFAVSILSIFILALCGREKYSDVKELLIRTIDINAEYISEMEKASNAGDVVIAIKSFTDGMGRIKPIKLEMDKKYPELYKDGEALPEKIIKLLEKLIEVQKSFIEVSGRVLSKYSEEQAVRKAWMELGNALKGI